MGFKKFVFSVVVLLALIGAYMAYDVYQKIYAPNVSLTASSEEFYIHSDWDFNDVVDALVDQGLIQKRSGFEWVANRKGYPELIKPGRYILLDGMNNNQLVNLLRSGEQAPMMVLIRSVRSKSQLVGWVTKFIEADSAALMGLLNDPSFCASYGFNVHTIFSMFIPNTYEFYWNTSEEEFVERMAREYKRFWTDERKAKAAAMKLTQSEVSTLASIVQAEQGIHPDERPKVAGLYLNRIRIGMRLESDPTLIHAIGDFSIKRVLNVHKEIDSPYNTYKRTGLPPGPILLPEESSMDAVLSAEKHQYIFMCAKEDFSGYHNFSVNYNDHVNNARRYQRELNKRKIFK